MPFIRIKKIKGNKYAYLVENRWRKRGVRGSRQKVKKYLGRVYMTEKLNDKSAEIDEAVSFRAIVKKLVKQEFVNRGFVEEGRLLKKDDFIIDITNLKFMKNDQSVVFEMNEGFACDFTLKSLLKFKPKDYEKIEGLDLATAIVEAGLIVPKEMFVKLFEKVYIG